MTQLTCNVEYSQTIIIYEDNQNVIVLIKNSQFHARIKHIDIQIYFIKKRMIEEFIDLIYVFIDQMIIDNLAKSLIKKNCSISRCFKNQIISFSARLLNDSNL
jgi:hypothetical protein